MKNALLDTGFLLALVYERDKYHKTATNTIKALNGRHIIPSPVLNELFWLLTSDRIYGLDARMKYRRAVSVLKHIQSAFLIEVVTVEDMRRMNEIMSKYDDARFDYVDVAVMAVSERLNVSTICTVDRQDFSYFVPENGNPLILLPEILR